MTSERSFETRLARLEADSACRRLLARYFALCDDLGPHTPIEELAGLFTRDALWEGVGRYQQAFGRYEGRAAIRAMLWSYCSPTPHFAMTAHFFSAEAIDAQAETATGHWMMLQTSTYADGRADLRSAELTLRFAVEEETWRIAHFRTRNLFSRREHHWSDEAEIPVPSSLFQGG